MPQGLTGHSGHTFWPTSSSPPIQLEQEKRPLPQRNTSQNGHTFWPITRIFNLRHWLTDFLRNGPGHIGYGIAREYRGHGYATAGLKLTLAKARELGIKEAYLSVHKTNPASLAVQQHCGARIDHEDKTEYYTRIATCMESDGLYARGD